MTKPRKKQNNAYSRRTGKNEYSKKGRPQGGRDRDFDERMETATGHKYNDWTWYAKNEAMLRDAASLSYNNPLGELILWNQVMGFAGPGAGTLSTTTQYPDSIPGLMAHGFMPTYGISTDSTSPMNLAAQNIYSYVRYMNSGSKNYDIPDLFLYLLTFDSIYMMWNWAKRIYGYARTYSQKNMYMPRAFYFADTHGAGDFDELISNLADFRYGLNQIASRIASFCVPAVMPMFIRHSWMVSNVYKDANNEKSQSYMFIPDFFYMYNESSSNKGGMLMRKCVVAKAADGDYVITNHNDILNLLTDMLDAVAYSEDIGVMSGDILKAYGQDKLFKISPIEPDYQVVPVYNEEVLNQMHNSTNLPVNVYGKSSVDSLWNITQNPDTNYLVWNPTWNMKEDQVEYVNRKIMINMPWDDITPANTMEATRLSALMDTNAAQNGHQLLTCGSEIVTQRYVVTYQNGGTGGIRALKSYNYSSDAIQLTTSNLDQAMNHIKVMSQFDWHPLQWLYVYTPSTKTVTPGGVMGDITNYTFVDEYTLAQMHLTAILSLFNVPQLGSF